MQLYDEIQATCIGIAECPQVQELYLLLLDSGSGYH